MAAGEVGGKGSGRYVTVTSCVRYMTACSGGWPLRAWPGQRKDDVMRERLAQSLAEGRTEGVAFAGRAQEKVRVWATTRRRDAEGKSYPWIVRESRVVAHWYFYCHDACAGPFFIKYCGYFPYNAKLCCNGNEYAKRMAAGAGIGFAPLDNGFAAVDDAAAVQEIRDSFDEAVIWDPAAKWTGLLPCPFTAEDAAADYRYEASVLQAEFSLTQVLDKPVTGRIFFEQVIRDNLDIGRPDRAGLIFGRRIIRKGPRATPGQFRTRVLTEGVIPTLHVDYKHSKIKQYHKEGKALRTETTINDTRDLGIGKRLDNLPALRAAGFAANRRLLGAQKISHDPADGHEAITQVCQPLTTGAGTRVAGLRLGDLRAHALLAALCVFRLLPRGFANRDLRPIMAQLLGVPAETITPGEDDLRPAPPADARPHRARPGYLPLPAHQDRHDERAVPHPPARQVPPHRPGRPRRAPRHGPRPGSRQPRLHRRRRRPRPAGRPRRLTLPASPAGYPDLKAQKRDSELKTRITQAS
jgi:hypothetical protein